MLTKNELSAIFSWQPYRKDWAVDRNHINDNIQAFYGRLIKQLRYNPFFETYYSEDGGLGNYLEFICYPKGNDSYRGNAVLLCISLCAPVAAYGQTTVSKEVDSISWSGLFAAEHTGLVTDPALTAIEREIQSLLHQHDLSLIDQMFASESLPVELAEEMQKENHNSGSQYLHGLFQKTD
jgi:hypothetical protein